MRPISRRAFLAGFGLTGLALTTGACSVVTPAPPPTATPRPAIPTPPPIAGEIDRETLEIYKDWPDRSRPDAPADLDAGALATLKEKLSGAELIVFVRSRCSDCAEQVPRFLRIIDQLGLPADKVKYYGLDGLAAPDSPVKKYRPADPFTVVVLRDGQEIGRYESRRNGRRLTVEAGLVEALERASRQRSRRTRPDRTPEATAVPQG